MHLNSLKCMKKFRDKYLYNSSAIAILDVGSRSVNGHPTYRELFPLPFDYTGMDIVPGDNVDIVGYEALEGRIFDVVICGQVLEHVNRPWEFLANLKRYFTQYICVIAPNTHGLHEYPIDTFRYFPDGMRSLFDVAGIVELEIYKDKKDTVGIGKS